MSTITVTTQAELPRARRPHGRSRRQRADLGRAALPHHVRALTNTRPTEGTRMRSEGLLERHGWIENDDARSGNRGKFVHRWWLTEMPGRPA